MCCGVVPILFGWFLSVSSLHALVFIQKTFWGLIDIYICTEDDAILMHSACNLQAALRVSINKQVLGKLL